MSDDLNARLKAFGMLTVEEQMQPMNRFQVHAGMTDLAFFGQWLDRKARDYAIMRAPFELGEKDKSDDLYEWVLAHSGAYHDVLVNFRAAMSRASLSDHPTVKALVAEAEARGMERAAVIVQRDADAANLDAEDAHQRGFSEAAFHIRQSAEAIASTIPAIRAEAATIRKGETT